MKFLSTSFFDSPPCTYNYLKHRCAASMVRHTVVAVIAISIGPAKKDPL